jgi:hypothetical protein
MRQLDDSLKVNCLELKLDGLIIWSMNNYGQV